MIFKLPLVICSVKIILSEYLGRHHGLMLLCWTLEQAVCMRLLSSNANWGHWLLCCWARYFTLTGPLSTQEYKRLSVILYLLLPPDIILGDNLLRTSVEVEYMIKANYSCAKLLCAIGATCSTVWATLAQVQTAVFTCV